MEVQSFHYMLCVLQIHGFDRFEMLCIHHYSTIMVNLDFTLIGSGITIEMIFYMCL